jgi:hypothetical protein
MERRLEKEVPLVFLKGLRQNVAGEVTGGWEEACDEDIQNVCFTKYHYESKHDKTGVTGMRRKEIHTQTYAITRRRENDNIKMDLKINVMCYLNLAQTGFVGWLF